MLYGEMNGTENLTSLTHLGNTSKALYRGMFNIIMQMIMNICNKAKGG